MIESARAKFRSPYQYPALLVGTFFLLIPAIWNHYPLVNPDVATYLASGFKPETPMDRPITYGLLLRLFSFNGCSLWPVVFIQGYMVAWLVFKTIQRCCGTASYLLKALIAVIFLSLCTSLSWLVSQVQPDMYTAVALLCIALLLIGGQSKANGVILHILFFISVAVHLSHPLLFVGVLVVLLLVKRTFTDNADRMKTNKKIALLTGLSLAAILIMGPALSKSKHVFFVGSLLEKGVLKTYLDDNCAAKNYKICAYKDVLPLKADAFWWDDNSPLYKMGTWKSVKPEFNDIIHDIMTTPKYLGLYLNAAARQAGQQAVTFNIGDGNTDFPKGTNLNGRIAEYLPREINSFDNDVQNKGPIWDALAIPNRIFVVVVLLSLLTIAVASMQWKGLQKEAKLLVLICITGVIFNILDCAAFSILNGRYGCKMIWLLPFCALCLMLNKVSSSIKQLN